MCHIVHDSLQGGAASTACQLAATFFDTKIQKKKSKKKEKKKKKKTVDFRFVGSHKYDGNVRLSDLLGALALATLLARCNRPAAGCSAS
jgi:hypothetical protein